MRSRIGPHDNPVDRVPTSIPKERPAAEHLVALLDVVPVLAVDMNFWQLCFLFSFKRWVGVVVVVVVVRNKRRSQLNKSEDVVFSSKKESRLKNHLHHPIFFEAADLYNFQMTRCLPKTKSGKVP